MENSVEAVFVPSMMEAFRSVFDLEQDAKLLGDFENYVYEVYQHGKPLILRITHSSHRTLEEILSEMDWINYLESTGVNTLRVYQSSHGNLVETVIAADGTSFFGSLFSKATGQSVKPDQPHFNEELFFAWGKQIGKMHRVTKDYRPKQNKRPDWYEDDLYSMERYVPNEPLVIEQTKKIIAQLKELPTTSDNFGLIHNDMHQGNFFYEAENLHVFDFDDSCYFWFVSDIAIPLYYVCLSKFQNSSIEEKEAYAQKFIIAFMSGYKEENLPPKHWKQYFPLFLKVRDITLYAALNKKIAIEDRNDRIRGMMQQLKERIENQEPIVSIDLKHV